MTARARKPERLRAMLRDPVTRALLQESATSFPSDAGAWLASLGLLTGLPFETIAADARMLPPESIRFFYADWNWIDAAIDGALSVGNISEQNGAMIEALTPRVKQSAGPVTPSDVWTGFLLRSIAVADFPGLQIAGYSDPDATQPLQLLRLELLSPTVMIAIFDGQAASFSITEPPHALSFGVEDPTTMSPVQGPFNVYLRGIGSPLDAGMSLIPPLMSPAAPPVPVPLREISPEFSVIDVGALQASLASALGDAYSSVQASPPPFLAAAFALQMVAAAESQIFTVDSDDEPSN